MRLRDLRREREVTRNVRRDVTPPNPERFAHFGEGAVIVPPTRVTRPDCISVGAGTVIHEGGWLSVVEAHEGRPPRLVIGKGVRLGRGASIACIGEVVLEDDVMASDDVFIADCYHEYRDAHVPVLDQPMSVPQPVLIERGAYLGAGCIVLPGITVGRGAYVGEGAVVTRDVPAHGRVYGNPARQVTG
jgi:acetyltransferase-like isoleucine patch superfamily enzyme